MSEKTFKIVNGDMSDGYHTFDELYEHRCLLFIALAEMTDNYHPDFNTFVVEEHYEGWDLIVLQHDNGSQISYHVPTRHRELYRHFDRFNEEDYHFDGHTSEDVLERIKSLILDSQEAL